MQCTYGDAVISSTVIRREECMYNDTEQLRQVLEIFRLQLDESADVSLFSSHLFSFGLFSTIATIWRCC